MCYIHLPIRDLKSDNILLNDIGPVPHLVVSDFGSCLAHDNGRMWVPYLSDDTNKGGNGSLMAPEVKNQLNIHVSILIQL